MPNNAIAVATDSSKKFDAPIKIHFSELQLYRTLQNLLRFFQAPSF